MIGLGIGENFIASDQLALLPVTRRFIFLEEGDVAEITRTTIKIFDKDPAILGKLSAGNRIQFYPIAFSEFEKLNEYK